MRYQEPPSAPPYRGDPDSGTAPRPSSCPTSDPGSPLRAQRTLLTAGDARLFRAPGLSGPRCADPPPRAGLHRTPASSLHTPHCGSHARFRSQAPGGQGPLRLLPSVTQPLANSEAPRRGSGHGAAQGPLAFQRRSKLQRHVLVRMHV